MNWSLETVSILRRQILNLVEGLDEKALNHIPANFNNNLIWHIAHIVATQQVIVYKSAGVPMVVDEAYVTAYRGGTKPERILNGGEIAHIKQLVTSTIQTNIADYQSDKFVTYTPWATRTGIMINTAEESLMALVFHESTHFGYMMALKRAVLLELGVK